MAIELEGRRVRYFHERVEREARAGDPLSDELDFSVRRRLLSDIEDLAWSTPKTGSPWPFMDMIIAITERITGRDFNIVTASNEKFFTFLEIAVGELYARRGNVNDVEQIQSILADNCCSFRFVETGDRDRRGQFQLHQIDNPHLHREIVDRTFDLTRDPAFASAQNDYAEAWKHYSSGDLDDAVVNAHKAFESAAKVVIKYIDSTTTPDQMQTNQIVPALVRLEILPSKLNSLVGNLQQIFLGAGSLRNQAGTGHGALVPTSPEATVALMALRMSGTLVSFLAERRTQLKPIH